MQRPVRYYITQSDDHAVVRSIPVAAPRPAPVDETPVSTAPQPAALETSRTDRGRTRVTRLVRAATRRADSTP